MILYLLLVGFVSLLSQVVLLRELTVAFYGIELIYLISLGFWLVFTATGALIGRRGFTPPVSILALAGILFSLIVPLDIAFIRGLRTVLGAVPGAYLPFGLQMIGIVLA